MGNASCQPANGVHFLGLEQLRFDSQAFAEIAAIRDKVRDLPFGVPYGSHALVHVIQVPILLAVHQNVAVDLAGTNGFPQLAIEHRRRLSRLQHVRRLAHELLLGIASQCLKSRIYILDDAVAIRNQNRIRRLLHRAGELAHGLLRHLPLLLRRVQAERATDRTHQVGPVKLRPLHAVIRARLDNFSDGFLVGVQKLRKKLGGRRISRLMFKQDQPVSGVLQHRFSLFQ